MSSVCCSRGRDDAGIMGHLRQLVRLRLGRPCRRQPAAGPVDQHAPKAECAGQLGQRAALAGKVHPVRGQPIHRGVVQQIDCRDGDQSKSSEGDVGVHVIRQEGLDRAAQRRHGRRVATRHPCGAALQKQIGGRVGRIPGGWEVTRRPCDLLQEGGAGGPPGVHGRLQCEEHARPSRHAGRAAAIVVPHRPGRRWPRPRARGANRILPSSWVACAVDRGSRRHLVASASRASARSTVPASRWACAADRRRSARRSSSGVSSAARSRNAAAAA